MEPLSQKTSRQRGFSFHSDKSRDPPGSPKSASKASKHERKHSDRDHYDPNTKTNPNAAMNELQPSMSCHVMSLQSRLVRISADAFFTGTAALEKPTLQSLRSFQHTDNAGNPIGELLLSLVFLLVLLLLLLSSSNDPQPILICLTLPVRDGSARSTRSVHSKQPSMANTGVGRSRCALIKQTL